MQQKMPYQKDERDMLVMHHEFVAEYTDHSESITSPMVDYGIPGGDSSMSRTVGLPAAIATRLILEGGITRKGVAVPVTADIYEPVLAELGKMGWLVALDLHRCGPDVRSLRTSAGSTSGPGFGSAATAVLL